MSLLQRLKHVRALCSGKPATAGQPKSRVIVTPPAPRVIRYVELLLSSLAERREEALLQASELLPVLDGAGGDPPPFSQVINRLKVLSGLDPVVYPHAMNGHFAYRRRERRYDVTACFDDRGDTPSCRVSVSTPIVEES